MQIALVIGILSGIFIGLVVLHYGIVNTLREASLYFLSAAKWCEAHRAGASASIHERLQSHVGPIQHSGRTLPPSNSSSHDPVDALRILLRVVETVPVEMIEKALSIDSVQGSGARNMGERGTQRRARTRSLPARSRAAKAFHHRWRA